jgi:phage terminase large subunit GpA-like protein
VHQSPSNFLWLVPTGKLHKRAAARIDKSIAAVPQLRERVAKPGSRDANNNNDIKEYVGGALYIATAGAAANLSELAVRRVLFDEIDRAKDNVGGEGDPTELAETRQTTFERNRKAYYPSSPTIEGESPIEALFLRGTQREALAECVHCGHVQALDFFKLIRSDDGKRALYPCEECGGLHEEGDKPRMFARGLWSAGVEGDGETESFHISAMFLPYGWIPWVSLMRQYDQAKAKLEEGSEEAMIVFYNTRLALCWARTKETTKYDELMQRAEPYRLGAVPDGACILTCAVDCQAYRLEMKTVGWGEGMEDWIVDYQVIHGPPSELATWEKLDELLKTRYRHDSGAMLSISATFINADGKGGTAQDVYNFTASRRRRNIFAVKGHSRPGRPILSSKPTLVDINWRGKSEKKGAQLWFVGPDTAKDYLQARWKKTAGPGATHFSEDLPESYYKGLTAEYRTYGYKRGRKTSWWEQKKGEPNEPLDLMVYNLGAAYYLGLHKKNEHQWQLLRDRLVPTQGDLLAAMDTYPKSAAAPSAPADRDGAPPPRRREEEPAPSVPAQPSRVVGGKIVLGSGTRRGG